MLDYTDLLNYEWDELSDETLDEIALEIKYMEELAEMHEEAMYWGVKEWKQRKVWSLS